MALTDGDKAEIKEIAREIIKEVMAEHVQTCPHGISMKYSKKMVAAIVIGCMLGSGLAGGTGIAIAKFLMTF